MQEEGYLAKILMPEGSKDVPVGQVFLIKHKKPLNSFFQFILDRGYYGRQR